MKCLSSLETNKINERSTSITTAALNTDDHFHFAKQLNIKSVSKAEENTDTEVKSQHSVTLHSISFIEIITNARLYWK